ncbi:MAG: hypothetical protein Q4D37_09955 [Oscillospiraceae bacterium]|nr:hypothetical protein [Oscillospiraceae bacterium]
MREINKKPFSVGLYIEGLRQLRIVGILGVILMFGSSMVMNVSQALSYRRQATLYPDESIVLYPVDGLDAMSFLLIVFCAFAPIMTWILFRFMNKRNSSDFMFAIPNTRLSIYCSYLSAIMTWIAAMILAGLIGVLLPAAIFSNYLNIMYDTVFLFALSTFLCSLQVVSAILIAMSITGTLFSNIILSGMLLFGPRLLITMLLAVQENIPLLCNNSDGLFLLKNSINPITGFVFGIVFGALDCSTKSVFYSAAPMIYSAVLSVIYLLLAIFFFQRRKSETAGKSAPNPILQAIYRITITMMYCIAVAVIIVSECDEMTSEMIFGIVVAYLVAVALYFLFELIMTKSLRKMWKAAPGLLIVLVLNGITIFGMRAAIHNAYQFQPTTDQVESISFAQQNFGSGDYIYYINYVQNKYKEEIKDKNLISNILKNLKEDTTLLEDGDRNNYYGNELRGTYTGMDFKIKTKSGTRYRYIRIDPKTQRALMEQVQQSFQNGNESWRIPPEPIEGSIWIYNNGGYNWNDSNKETVLFDQLKEELQTIDFTDWYDVNNSETEMATFYFNYEVQTEDKETYQFNLPVYASLYPKTAELYNTYLYENEKEEIAAAKQFVETKMQALKLNDDYSVYITAYYYDKQSQSYQTTDISNPAFLKKIFEEGLLDQPIGSTDSYVDININVYYDEYTYDEDAYYGGNLRVAVKSDILKSLVADSY